MGLTSITDEVAVICLLNGTYSMSSQIAPNVSKIVPNLCILHLLLTKVRNSSLVFALDRIHPNIQLVVAVAPDFCTPLITIQRWLDSITTPTPCGISTSAMASATCLVNLSWTCSLRENISASRASFERPRTRSGHYQHGRKKARWLARLRLGI